MLRRHRLIRMQIHQLMDACLFAASFWLAYGLRSNPDNIDLLGLQPVNEFNNYVWLYLILIPAAPMILVAHGFYNRPPPFVRRLICWMLLRSCLLSALGMILFS